MKKLTVLALIGALFLGLSENDCTGFATLFVFFAPILFQKESEG